MYVLSIYVFRYDKFGTSSCGLHKTWPLTCPPYLKVKTIKYIYIYIYIYMHIMYHIFWSVKIEVIKEFFFYCCTVHFDIRRVHSPTNAFFSFKKHIKIYIKIHINIAPICFGLRSSSGSLH